MGVIQAKIQTVDGIYRLVRTAVVNKHPIRLCYQFAGESSSGLQADGSPENWRCIALEKLSSVQLLEGSWHTAPNHSRQQTCIVDVDVDAED